MLYSQLAFLLTAEFFVFVILRAVVRFEEAFTQAKGGWGDFEVFVFVQEGDALFHGHVAWALELDGVVLTGGTGIGELFAFADVDGDVLVTCLL